MRRGRCHRHLGVVLIEPCLDLLEELFPESSSLLEVAAFGKTAACGSSFVLGEEDLMLVETFQVMPFKADLGESYRDNWSLARDEPRQLRSRDEVAR